LSHRATGSFVHDSTSPLMLFGRTSSGRWEEYTRFQRIRVKYGASRPPVGHVVSWVGNGKKGREIE
jgi:hypothetical protein